MAYEHKINSGSIFKNDYKQNPNQPDYKGQVNVDGVMKDIALWVKDGQKGKFFSVSIQEPYRKPDAQPQVTNTTEEDVPF
jgi:hypothetical protein